MNKKIWATAKINFKTIKVAYWIAGGVMLALFATSLLTFIFMTGDGGTLAELSPGNALWLVPALAAILIPARNFRRIVNLGGKRNNFIWGSLTVYVILAAAVSYVVTLMNVTIEPFVERSPYLETEFFGGVMNLAEVFGWAERGFIPAFLQQFALLFFLQSFLHTLTAMHAKWYGWAADIAIIAVISVFTPIAPLRAALVWFFNLILFHQNGFLQFLACMALGLAIYMVNKPLLARQAI